MGRDSWSDRLAVEDCRKLSISEFNDDGCLKNSFTQGTTTWSDLYGKKTASISFQIRLSPNDGIGLIRLMYSRSTNSCKKEDYDYIVRLEATPCNFGGKRWWFLCPLVINGKTCNRRVSALYLGNSPYFGCRHCYNLTYRSCQESHKYDVLFRDSAITPQQSKFYLKYGRR